MQKNKKHLIILLVVSCIILVSNLGALPVNIMEARNFITAREMVQDNNWILTTMNGEPRYEKPPLPTWITAVFGLLFGFDSVFVLRLAVVLITLLLVFYIYKFSLEMQLSENQAWINGLVLITSFYIYFAGRDNQWDIYCHSFMIVSLYYLWKILQNKNSSIKNSLLGGLFLGCSILSKGPISLYTLFLPFLIAYFWVYKIKVKELAYDKKALALYIVSGIVIGGSWSLYIHIMDPGPLERMAKVETSRWVNDYNKKSIIYYWDFFIQSGIWAISSLIALVYPYMKLRVSDIKAYKFTMIWTVTSLILLSIVPEKKVRYILPTLIPLALNTGFYIEYICRGILSKKDKWWVYINFGLLGLVGLIYPGIVFILFKNVIQLQEEWAVISSVILFIIGIGIFIYLIRNQFTRAFHALILLQCAVMVFVFPLSESFLFNPKYKSAKEILKYVRPEYVYDFGGAAPEIIWDFGGEIPVFNLKSVEKDFERKNKIGVLCIQDKEQELIKQVKNKYKIYKVSYLDLNTVSPENKSYKGRLVRNFYILKKASDRSL